MVLVHVGYLVLPVFGSVRNRGTVLIFISIPNMCPVYLNIHCSCLLASSSLALGLARVSQLKINGNIIRKTCPQRNTTLLLFTSIEINHRIKLFAERNSAYFKINTAAKDKLTGSLAQAMSWNGNISHKGFHRHGACCRK